MQRGYVRFRLGYFPGSSESVSRHLIFHEMKAIFDRTPESS